MGRTRGWIRNGLSSKALLADVSTVRNCQVAERTVVRMIRWTMSIDEDLVTLLVDRTSVNLDGRRVNGFTLWISTWIRATDSRCGRGGMGNG